MTISVCTYFYGIDFFFSLNNVIYEFVNSTKNFSAAFLPKANCNSECISYKVDTFTMFFFTYSMKVNFTAETSAHEKCC